MTYLYNARSRIAQPVETENMGKAITRITRFHEKSAIEARGNWETGSATIDSDGEGLIRGSSLSA